MSKKENNSDFRNKLLILLIDKFILALLIAFIGFFLNIYLQHDKIRGDYQKTIYEKRVEAYIEIFDEAKYAIDILFIFYSPDDSEEKILGELQRREQLKEIHQRMRNLNSDGGGSGFSWVLRSDILEPLNKIDTIMREKDFYISNEIKKSIGNFLDILMEDILYELEFVETANLEGNDEYYLDPKYNDLNQKAWIRAKSAYQELRTIIKESLRIEGIILG